MSGFEVYRPHSEAPAQAIFRGEPRGGAREGMNAQRFEIISRGDFVPGVLVLPDPSPPTPAPLLLLQPGTSQGMDSEALECASSWVEKGLAVATIDLPLHGRRSSPKLSERLVSGIGQLSTGPGLDAETRALVEEFARQATSDLVRTFDALAELPTIDGDRFGFMGIGLGGIVGSYLLAHDRRPRAAVLALTRAGQGPGDLDPATYLAKSAGTSILIAATEVDEKSSTNSPDPLFEAAPEPKRFLRLPSGARALPDEANAEIWRFLSKELGL